MGTHPIFESDFDCLTDGKIDKYKIAPLTGGGELEAGKREEVG